MNCMFVAIGTVFFELNSIGLCTLVFRRCVIPTFTIYTSEDDIFPHESLYFIVSAVPGLCGVSRPRLTPPPTTYLPCQPRTADTTTYHLPIVSAEDG